MKLKFTATKNADGYYQILYRGEAVSYEGQPFLCGGSDVGEVLKHLNGGVDVAEFFPAGGDYYGSPEHAAFGDAWFYNDVEGAW